MKPRKITSLAQLKELTLPGADVYIAMAHGLFSRKLVTWDPVDGVFDIYNHIDEKEQLIPAEQIFDPEVTCLGNAMRLGVLYEGDGAISRSQAGAYPDSLKKAGPWRDLTPEPTQKPGDGQ